MIDPLSIFEAAASSPQGIALVAGRQTYTFAEVAARTAQVVTWLDRRKERTARVALVASASIDTLLLIYALLARGEPAAFLHPRLTTAERTRLARVYAAGAPLLLVEEPTVELQEAYGLPPTAVVSRLDDEAPLGVLFTSGTTGHPKGVVLSRRAFLASAAASAANLGWEADDRWLLCMPVAHVGGLSVVVRCLVARKAIVLEPRFDPAAVADVIAREHVSIVSLVPTMLARIFDVVPDYRSSPALRVVLLGGAGTPAKLLGAALDRGVPALTTYGMTESCSQVTTQRYGTKPSITDGSGEPLVGASLRVVDERIEVRGPMLFSGYWGEHARAPDAWFRTTDFGAFDEQGRLHVRGRVKERIVTGGENVDPAEVEAELERVEGIRAACVFGVQDDVWGEIVCVALVGEGARTPAVDLSTLFRERLASHKRPRRVVWLAALALATSGKLDRAATRAWAEAGLVNVSSIG